MVPQVKLGNVTHEGLGSIKPASQCILGQESREKGERCGVREQKGQAGRRTVRPQYPLKPCSDASSLT